MTENHIEGTIEALFKGIDGFVSTKTVIGDAITVGDTTIVPIVDVSFGMGAGSFAKEHYNNGGAGMGGKVTPTAVLVIQDGKTKMISVKSQDVATKIVDLIPDLVEKVAAKRKEPDVDLDKVLDEAAEQKQ